MSGTVGERQYAVKTPQPTQSAAGRSVSDLTAHVFRLNALLTAAGDEMAAPSGQTTARWRVLSVIDEEPATVPHIARSWWLTRQSVQRIADVLVADGLAAYEDNAEHRRSKLLRITPAGLAGLGDIRAAQATWADDLGASLDERRLLVANEVLSQVVATLGERTSPGVGGL